MGFHKIFAKCWENAREMTTFIANLFQIFLHIIDSNTIINTITIIFEMC